MKNEHVRPYKIHDGRDRLVYGPDEWLKGELRVLHRHLLYRLTQNPTFRRLYQENIIHGFVPGRSFVTHARAHAGSRTIAVFDLYHAFESVPGERVAAALDLLKIDPEYASFIKDNTLINGCLAVGFPTSPDIFNTVLLGMDRELLQFANVRDLRYSRYADDIAISSTPAGGEAVTEDDVLRAMQIIRGNGFDPHKIRVGYPWQTPFRMCGVSLYEDAVAIPDKAMRRIKGQLHAWLVGVDEPHYDWALSLIGHIKSIRPLPARLEKYEKLARNFLEEGRKLKMSEKQRRAVHFYPDFF